MSNFVIEYVPFGKLTELQKTAAAKMALHVGYAYREIDSMYVGILGRDVVSVGERGPKVKAK